MRAMKKITFISILAASLPLLLVAPAIGEDRGDLGVVSPTLSISGSFPALLTEYPHKQGSQFFTYRRPARCSVEKYCDTMTFSVDKPKGYDELYEVVIRVSWTSPDNDLDFYVWPDDDPALGGPVISGNSRGASNQEEARMGEPEAGKLWLTVVNFTGFNSGYSLSMFWRIQDLGEADYNRPPQRTPPRSPTPDRRVSDDDVGAGTFPQVTTSPIKVPGPDGELVEMELPVYVQAAEQERPKRSNPLIAIAISGVILLMLGFGFFVWRSRRTREPESPW